MKNPLIIICLSMFVFACDSLSPEQISPSNTETSLPNSTSENSSTENKWMIQSSNTEANLKSVSFVDKQTGWVGGGNTILKTGNGGDSWEDLSPPQKGDWDLDFYNESLGAAISNGQILITKDGGNSWQKPPKSLDFTCTEIQFVSAQIAFASCTNSVYKSEDAGQNWNKLSLSDLPLPRVSSRGWDFLDPSTGLVANYLTLNGGNNFIETTPPSALNAVQFIGNALYAVSGTTFLTYGEEAGWKEFKHPDPPMVYFNNPTALAFSSTQRGWVSWGTQISMTEDGGKTWEAEALPKEVRSNIFDLEVPTGSSQGWAVGAKGLILKRR